MWGMCKFKYKIVEMSVAKTVNSNESAKRRELSLNQVSKIIVPSLLVRERSYCCICINPRVIHGHD